MNQRAIFCAAALLAACTQFADGEQRVETEHTASALTGSSFEGADGNLTVNTTGNKDWSNAPNLATGIDLPTGQTDNSLGQGAKEDISAPTIVAGSIPNNKSDLTRFYVSNEHVGTKDFLYLAWERANTLGTANMDFEFNQSATVSSNGVTPVRTAGDILITFDFGQGGNAVDLGLLRWITAGPASQCFSANAVPCWGNRVDLSNAGFAEGAVNNGSVPDPITGATLPDKTFGEAAINLTDAGVLDPNSCTSFGRAFLKSRSSDSFKAELKDFIAPIPVSINNCQPATIKLKKVDATGAALGGAVMQLFADSNNNGVLDATDQQVGSNCTTSATDGIGTCSFSITTNGRYIGHELTPPPGYAGTANDKSTVVTVTSTAQTITLTFDNSPVPGRIDITKVDDSTPAKVLQGATFELFVDTAPTGGSPGAEDTTSLGTCTTDATGKCSFTNVPLGTYWVVETAAPPGYAKPAQPYKSATIGLGADPNQGQTVSFTFVNARQYRIIVMVCRTDGTLYPSTINVDSLGAQTSISAAQAITAGTDEATLCGLTQARFDNLAGGSHTGTMAIP